MTDVDFEEIDEGMLEAALEESRRTLDQKNKTFREISRKAERILYANVATIAALVTASQVFGLKMTTLWGFAVGGLLMSLLASIASYWTSEIHQGTGQAVIEKAIERDHTQNKFMSWLLLEVYPDGIQATGESIRRKRLLLKISILAYVVSILVFVAWILVRGL